MNEHTLSHCRVLVVEDEFLVAEELNMELADAGAVVVGPVGSVTDALQLIAGEQKIDAAVLDVNLGGEMVFAAADLLSERGVPFVFTTGYGGGVIPKRFEHVVRCEKPTNITDVVTAIGRALHS